MTLGSRPKEPIQMKVSLTGESGRSSAQLEDPDPTRSRPSSLSKAALRSDRLLIGSTSPKQPFVAASSRPEAATGLLGGPASE